MSTLTIQKALRKTERPHLRVNVGNVDIDNVNISEAIALIEEFVQERRVCYLGNPNVDVTVRIQSDPMLANYYKNAALTLVDGVPVMWAAKFLGSPLKEKISGSDLVPEICKLAEQKGYKLYFLGGRPGAAAAAKEILEVKYPDINIVGTYAPPFGFEKDEREMERIFSKIREAAPDILLVGLGVPKQEKFIAACYRELQVPVSMGVGVTFEFIAGIVKRAPLWMQRSGLEWFWRLCMEPGRLWKRYLVDDLQFLTLIWKQKKAASKK